MMHDTLTQLRSNNLQNLKFSQYKFYKLVNIYLIVSSQCKDYETVISTSIQKKAKKSPAYDVRGGHFYTCDVTTGMFSIDVVTCFSQ